LTFFIPPNPFPDPCIVQIEINPLVRFSFFRENSMKKNIGNADRALRALFAVAVAVLYFAGQISGTVALILGIFAVIFLLTSVVGSCPLYLPFKFSTKKPAA
jgi:hypothetical protein